MLGDAGIVTTVAAQLERRRPPFTILDPVLRATSGAQLLDAIALELLRVQMLPLVDCLTPNLAEAAALLNAPCARTERDMEAQGRAL
ncbi:bifunctional hydroxymethylpyrimidine kinase/phosphomethylpyrimidine kinase, partial [Xenorhabdus bovienii]|uniref:bifunctional hydroxymethylpyrimidine kinase/phosphomethylpyrimidine kinase n=1 Tax=Xenorhabdus bovienii TaxID=40576 RepID=UPI0023B22B09